MWFINRELYFIPPSLEVQGVKYLVPYKPLEGMGSAKLAQQRSCQTSYRKLKADMKFRMGKAKGQTGRID
jgi:hypothetical protein